MIRCEFAFLVLDVVNCNTVEFVMIGVVEGTCQPHDYWFRSRVTHTHFLRNECT